MLRGKGILVILAGLAVVASIVVALTLRPRPPVGMVDVADVPPVDERSLGSADAPVAIVEYSDFG